MLSHASTRGVQLVVISPLMRAMETAAGVFGAELPGSQSEAPPPPPRPTSPSRGRGFFGFSRPRQEPATPATASSSAAAAQAATASSSNGASQQPADMPLLFVGQTSEPSSRAAFQALAAPPSVKFIVHESCRERLGGCILRRGGGKLGACIFQSRVQGMRGAFWRIQLLHCSAAALHVGKERPTGWQCSPASPPDAFRALCV